MSAIELFVPGRLCIVGEHSDWAGGYRRLGLGVEPGLCMVTGTDQGLHATAERLDGVFELQQVDASGDPAPSTAYPADPEALAEVARSGLFDSYAAGTASLVLQRFPGLGLGLRISRRTLPLQKGLSSSAAISVLTVRAFNRIHDLGLTIEEEMDLAYGGETMTGSSCGRMDQACAFGSIPVVLEFDGDGLGLRRLGPHAPLYLLIADLGRVKDTRRILADLNAAFLAGDPGVRDALGPSNRRILAAACSAVESGDMQALGGLMLEAQAIFDMQVAPACPSELSAPLLHEALRHPAVSELAWGAKGVGSQGDGSAQFLCRDFEARRLLAAELGLDLGLSCLDLTIPASTETSRQSVPEISSVP